MTVDFIEMCNNAIAPLGLICLPGSEEVVSKIDEYTVLWRKLRMESNADDVDPSIIQEYISQKELGIITEDEYEQYIREFKNDRMMFDRLSKFYSKESYIVKASFPRFSTGEGVCYLRQDVSGYDIFIICDIFNYNVNYQLRDSYLVQYSPDEHYANIRRAISAINGKAKRINVIMPMLYEGRVSDRQSMRSLDCQDMLQDLYYNMGVDNIFTFDCDELIQREFPLKKFYNIQPRYQMIKTWINNEPNLEIDKDHLIFFSDIDGVENRAKFYSDVFGVEMGFYYCCRDYSRTVKGMNPIKERRISAPDYYGKDAVIITDMITSGEVIIDHAKQIKQGGAKSVTVLSTFWVLGSDLSLFDKAYEEGIIKHIYSSNLTFHGAPFGNDGPLSREWFSIVDMTKYLALLIDAVNHKSSLENLLNDKLRIEPLLEKKRNKTNNSTTE